MAGRIPETEHLRGLISAVIHAIMESINEKILGKDNAHATSE